MTSEKMLIKKSNPRNLNSFDEVLEHVAGGAGYWQVGTLLISLPLLMIGLVPLLLHLFTAYTPAHRCMVPVCENVMNTSITQPWLDMAIPNHNHHHNFLSEKTSSNQCEMYSYQWLNGSCSDDNFDQTDLATCTDGYVFDYADFSETIVTKFNLVCDKEYHYQLLGTILMLGLLIGSIIGGIVADYYGRRLSMLLAILLICPSLVIGGFSSNYEVYAMLRFINCVGLPMVWLSMHNIILEMFSEQYKWLVACIESVFGVLSFLTLALIAFLFRDWSTLHFACGTVCFICSIFWIWMPESIRWLAQNNQIEKAKANLANIARINNRSLDEEGMQKIETILEDIHKCSQKEKEKHLNPMDMFKHGYTELTLIQLLCWITLNVGNYTLLLNATQLSGDVILNFTYTALSEAPAILLMFTTLK